MDLLLSPGPADLAPQGGHQGLKIPLGGAQVFEQGPGSRAYPSTCLRSACSASLLVAMSMIVLPVRPVTARSAVSSTRVVVSQPEETDRAVVARIRRSVALLVRSGALMTPLYTVCHRKEVRSQT